MKNFKKIKALLIALLVVLSMSSLAFAAGTGSITITPSEDVDGSEAITYNIYVVFDADASEDGSRISYKLVDGKTEAPEGFKVDSSGNVTYAGGDDVTELTQDDIDAIAAYVKGDSPVATVTSTGGAVAVAENLPNGYYFITTTTGSVVTINSTKPDAEVIDKNIVPSVDKKITNASSYDEDGKKALAQVGTQVEYTATVTVGKGQIGYVFKDTLGTGLEYVDGSLEVKDMTVNSDYTLSVSGQNLTVSFEDESIKDLKEGAEIVVTYKATVTSDALQDNPAKNTATISYGTDSQYTSKPSEAEVYNAKISVEKQDENEKPLAGAGFVLMNGDDEYYKIEDGVVSWVESVDDATEYTSGDDGSLDGEFTGLANGTYTLVENTVPAGYNKADDQDITINEHDYTASNLKQEATVVNKSGSVLPSTGGIGTTIFYLIGAVLVVCASLALAVRRRMNAK